MTGEGVKLGRLRPPYGGVTNCAASECQAELNEENGAYLFKDLETGKLVTFCEATAAYVELNRRDRWVLVAL